MLFVTPCNALLKHWIEVLRNVILLVVILFNMSEEGGRGGGYISLLIKYLRRTCSGSYIWIVPTIPWHAPVQSMNRFMVVKISWSAMGGFNITVSHFSKMLTIPCTETCSIRPCHSKQAAEVLFIFKITSILIERAMCNEHDELPLTIVYNTCSGSEDDTCFVIILSFISFN